MFRKLIMFFLIVYLPTQKVIKISVITCIQNEISHFFIKWFDEILFFAVPIIIFFFIIPIIILFHGMRCTTVIFNYVNGISIVAIYEIFAYTTFTTQAAATTKLAFSTITFQCSLCWSNQHNMMYATEYMFLAT